MGQNMGQLISKFGRKLRDIDIKKMTVSLIAHTACIAAGGPLCGPVRTFTSLVSCKERQ